MMWDCALTILSLALAAWFILIEPQVRRWHAFVSARREREEEQQLPPPRYAPLDQQDEGKETPRQRFDHLIKEIVALGEPVQEPGTGAEAVPTDTPDTPDTNEQDGRYQQIRSFVRAGYSGNQICRILGGNRADVLTLVRRAKREI